MLSLTVYRTFLIGLALCAGVSGQVQYPCEEFGREVGYLNHATSCEKFVICISGLPSIRNCAPGLRFDIESEQCRENANCIVDLMACPLYDDPSSLVFFPNPHLCNHYWMCANGEPMDRMCAPGLHWDEDNEWCNRPELANCENRVECPSEGIVYLPHPTLCDMYFVCMEGDKTMAKCADGLIFDVTRGACFFKEQSLCIVDVEPEITTTTTTTENSSTEQNTEQTLLPTWFGVD